ncbi:uncharacterized protein Gm33099 [Mus musculus]|uniref:uncharacterized protein Gm33099 n=1 Tax=Mus musculus TaxID=10090 RepID=UPI0003D753A3|nr:uncharacterized protein Gm33099 [Mus musculus]|eukprot:XP_006534705.1 PREDICTED: uncharacterized protein Gm33099 [Mus musculus]
MAWLRMRRRCREELNECRASDRSCLATETETNDRPVLLYFIITLFPASEPLPCSPTEAHLYRFLPKSHHHQEDHPGGWSGAEDETQDFSYPLSYTPQPCKLLDSVPLRGKGTAQEWSNLLFSREETAEESSFVCLAPGSRLTTPVRAWHCARCAPAAGSRSQLRLLACRAPWHVPRAPLTRAAPLQVASAPTLTSRGRLGTVGGPGSEVGAAGTAAGRGRCAFKVPPPRGRETACASPIPPGSARDEKHNA